MRLRKTEQQGVALLEALIAVLVFSIGVLALLGMLARSMADTADAKYRTEAALLSNQLIGTMWSDAGPLRANLPNYNYSGSGSPPAALAAWVAEVDSLLPNAATNRPIVVATAAGAVSITVRWKPPKGSEVHKHVTTTNIQ